MRVLNGEMENKNSLLLEDLLDSLELDAQDSSSPCSLQTDDCMPITTV